MRENLKSTSFRSFAAAVSIHLSILIIFYLIEIHKPVNERGLVSINFESKIAEADIPELKKEVNYYAGQSVIQKNTAADSSIRITKEASEVNVSKTEIDTLLLLTNLINILSDSLASRESGLDKLLIGNPSLLTMKTFAAEKIRNSEPQQDDIFEVRRKELKEFLTAKFIDRYGDFNPDKYPPPGNAPGMIRIQIPIDSIIDLIDSLF